MNLYFTVTFCIALMVCAASAGKYITFVLNERNVRMGFFYILFFSLHLDETCVTKLCSALKGISEDENTPESLQRHLHGTIRDISAKEHCFNEGKLRCLRDSLFKFGQINIAKARKICTETQEMLFKRVQSEVKRGLLNMQNVNDGQNAGKSACEILDNITDFIGSS